MEPTNQLKSNALHISDIKEWIAKAEALNSVNQADATVVFKVQTNGNGVPMEISSIIDINYSIARNKITIVLGN